MRNHTEEHKRKISLALKGRFREPKNPEHVKKIAIILKGRHLSPNSEFKKEHTVSVETRRKISQTRKNKKYNHSKENNPNWKNGLSILPYSTDWTETLRRSIRERDHYLCAICKLNGLDVHHIDYNKKNCNPANLITLCHNCHMKTNGNRTYWIKYFNNLV